MGEGGLAPEAFFRASLYEIVHFAAGLRRRYREGWLQARYIAYMAAAPHCKGLEFDNMIKFSWEEDAHDEAVTEEERTEALQRLRARIPIIEEALKNGRS